MTFYYLIFYIKIKPKLGILLSCAKSKYRIFVLHICFKKVEKKFSNFPYIVAIESIMPQVYNISEDFENYANEIAAI